MMAEKIRVLYVDDEPLLLDVCKQLLEKSGDFTVTTALSAPEAIRILKHERFDAIVSDYQMPEMDGIKFLKHIKAKRNTTPFIIITGKGCEEVVIEALDAGSDFYIQKSGKSKSHFAELSQKIKKAVESRRVEEALVESEERFRTLVASVNEVIILQEKTGEILTWNRAAERLFGVTSREVLGHTATSRKWKTIREDGTDFPDAEHPSMHTLATGEACKNVVMGITSAEGRFTWVNINTSPLFKQGDANPYAVVISLLDITERKGFEAILQQSENKFATVFRNSPVALTLVSATDGTFVDVNDTFVRSTGYSRDEVIGITSETLGIFVDSNERERMVSTIRDLRCVNDVELKCRIKTGEIQICLFSACLILLGGKPYIISTIEDITGRKRAEEALRESKRELADIISFLPDATLVIDKNGTVLAWNRAMEEMTGVPAEQILGKGKYEYALPFYHERRPITIDLVLHDNPAVVAKYPVMKKEGNSLLSEIFIPHLNNGRGAHLWFTASPLYDADGNISGAIESIRDITERKRMEEVLKESENRYRSLFEGVPVGRYRTTPSGQILDINPALVRLLGYPDRESLMAVSVFDIFKNPRERTQWIDRIERDGIVPDFEVQFRTYDGTIIWVQDTGESVRDGSGQVIYYNGNVVDITERKKAEDALRESEEKYRMLVETLNEGIWVIDKEAVTTYVNPKMGDILGYTVEEITGRSLFAFMDDEGRRICERNIERRQQGIKEQHDFEFLKKDGTRIYASLETSPIKGKDGEYLGAIAGVMDITERKQAQEALRDSEERYRRLFEGVPVGRYRTTPSGQILDINPALVRLLGYPDRKSLLGVSVPDLYMHPGERNRWLALIEREGIVRDFEVQFRTYDGTIIWVRDTGEAVRDASDQVIYFNGNVEDITERKRVEKVLRESEAYYRTIFENTGTASVIVEEDTTISLANAEFANLSGYPREEIEGKRRWTEFVVKEDLEWMLSQHNSRRKERKKAERNYEFRFVRKNGEVRNIYLSIDVISGTKKSIASLLDITEYKKAEQALRDSEERYRNVVEDQTELICRFLPDGTHIFVNEAYCRYFDKKREEIIGHRFKPVLHPEDREIVARHIASLTSLNPVMNIDQRIIMPDGSTRWQRWSDRAIFHADGSLKEYQSVGRDITDRKQDEEALQETNEYLHKLIDFGNAPIIVWNPEFEITRFNQASEHLTGRTEQEVIGQKIDILFPADNRKASLALIKKTLEGERWEVVEIPILASDGTSRTVLWNTANILTAEAELISTFAQGVDITERKQVEETLRESEEKFRSLVEHALEGIMVLDLQGTILFANNATARTLEVDDRAGLIGRNVMEFVAPESREDVVKDFIEVSQGHDAYLAQYNIISAKGNNFTLESIGKVIRYEGKPADLVSIRDITERKRVEKALRKSEEIHRLVLEFAGISSTLWTTDGYLLMINRYGAANLNGVPKEFIGKTMTDLFGPEAGAVYLERIRQVAATGTRMEFEDRVPLREDDKWFLSAHTRITDDHGQVKCVMVFSHDITERKQAEDTIKSALAEKEVLLREIHHRVKNNLAGIISLIDLQIGSLTDPVNISVLKDLETRIRSMALVHESLYQTKDLAKINFTSYTENLTRYLFQVYGTATDIRCRIEMEDITMSIDTAIPCGLVINEIVTNSLKYAFPQTFSCQEIRGEPCTITLTLHREGSDYLLKIADNGIGIPEGIGVTMSHSLGLYLIRFIVKHQLRGRLEISTARGTTYTIRFPEPVVKERHSDEKL